MSRVRPTLRSTGPRHSPLDELREAVSLRAAVLVLGGLVIQLAFIVSYVGAFHSPEPHRIPVAVVAARPAVADQVVDMLNGLPDEPLKASAMADEDEARSAILHRKVDTAILVDPTGTTDTLLTASAGGPAVSQAATQLAQSLEQTRHRQVQVVDIRPAAKGDGRGATSFYLVIGWVLGGYLTASILGVVGGRLTSTVRGAVRIGALALYAIVSGLAGAVIVGPVFGALPGSVAHLWTIGTLVVIAAAATATALQTLFGIAGVGVSILLFVVLGNPSSGGIYPASLLPPFWRAVGQVLPPGAGTTAVRNIVYFDCHATAPAVATLITYALGGTIVTLIAAALHGARLSTSPTGTAVHGRHRVGDRNGGPVPDLFPHNQGA